MSINSSSAYNIYSALGVKNNGIGGLASGLDTDSLVNAMTAATRNRIALQQISRQTLNWKMTAYRSAATVLGNFQKKNFSYTSSATSNILSPSFFNTYKTTSSSDAISVSGGTSTNDFQVKSVDRLATAQTLKQAISLSENLVGSVDISVAGNYTEKNLKLDVDGTVKSIKLDSLNGKSGQTLADELQDLLNDAFGTMIDGSSHVMIGLDGNKLKISSDTATVFIAEESDVLGFKYGATNRVSPGAQLKDIAAFAGLQGDSFTFKINGAEITVKATDTVSKLQSAINSSTAGATLLYDSVKGEFKLASNQTGGGNNLEIEDVDGNLMNLFFGAKGGTGIASKAFDNYDFTDKNLLHSTTLANLGVTASAASSITINGTTIAINDSMTVQDMMDDINNQLGQNTAKIVNGRLSINHSSGGSATITQTADTDFLNKIFGLDSYTTNGTSADYSVRLASGRGQNAEITLEDGTKVSQTNNTFSLNGVSLTLNKVSTDAINIRTTSDPEDVITRIKDFISEYNTIIGTLNTLIYEENDSSYTALSDEQKAQMTADEIEKYETLAKKGILRGDNTIRQIIQQFREAIYKTVESAGVAGYSLGITTVNVLNGGSVNQLDNGKLEITAEGEKTLRNALLNNPDIVREFFTNQEDGLSQRFNSIINGAIDASSLPEKRGSLVRIAGTDKATGDNASSLGMQINLVDSKLTTLKQRLEREYNRYWAQFSALEVSIQKMNTQSSWLMDFGSQTR